jgi:hypothetical protein
MPSPRHKHIIEAVWRHRFLTSHQVERLDGGSPDKLRRHLRDLYDSAYLEKHDLPHPYRADVYGIGTAAPTTWHTRLASRASGSTTAAAFETGRINGSSNTRSSRAELMVGFELAARAQPTIEYLDFARILSNASPAAQRDRNPHSWPAPFEWKGERYEERIVPDRIFGMRFAERPAPNEGYFFVESDTGSETVIPSTIYGSSFLKKILQYAATRNAWRAPNAEPWFGFQFFRVLTVTNGAQRAENLARAVSHATGGRLLKMFLFTHREAIEGADPLSVAWLRADLARVKLLEDEAASNTHG